MTRNNPNADVSINQPLSRRGDDDCSQSLQQCDNLIVVVRRRHGYWAGKRDCLCSSCLSVLQAVNPSGDGSATRVLLRRLSRSSASSGVRFSVMRYGVYASLVSCV